MPMTDNHESKIYSTASNLVSIKSQDSDDENEMTQPSTQPSQPLPTVVESESRSEKPEQINVDSKSQASPDFQECSKIVNARIEDEVISLKKNMFQYYSDKSKYFRVFEQKLQTPLFVCRAVHRRLVDEGFEVYTYKRSHSKYSNYYPPGYYIMIAPFKFDKDEPTSMN